MCVYVFSPVVKCMRNKTMSTQCSWRKYVREKSELYSRVVHFNGQNTNEKV